MSTIKSLTSRFIYSFFHSENSTDSTLTALQTLKIGEKTVWHPVEKPKEFYRQEMLTSLVQFIFDQPPQYLVVNPEIANQWFGKGITVTFGKNKDGSPKESFDAKLSTQTEIEIFLLPQGVGVLSIPLTAVENDDESVVKRFNYRLSQALDAKIPQLSLPHNNHPNAPAAPAEDSLLLERLGKRGGKFTLVELRNFLLNPLNFEEIQAQFSVYSVVRFDDTDFSDSNIQTALFPLLVGLTHIEEPLHAGSLDVPHKVLNTRHWSAVGTLGAIHFVADQAGAIEFNEQRVPTVFNKYFLPYLAVLLQRLILHRILQQAQTTLRDHQQDVTKDLQNLHADMLTFMLKGYLGEVSSREVINQYYFLARKALRVEESFEILRRALHDADLKEDVKFQCQSADESKNSLNQMIAMQRKIEWLEMFFASYYAGALAHYIGYGWFNHAFSSASTLFWAFFAGFMVFWGLKHEEESKRTSTWLSIVAVFVVWIIVGFTCFPTDGAHLI